MIINLLSFRTKSRPWATVSFHPVEGGAGEIISFDRYSPFFKTMEALKHLHWAHCCVSKCYLYQVIKFDGHISGFLAEQNQHTCSVLSIIGKSTSDKNIWNIETYPNDRREGKRCNYTWTYSSISGRIYRGRVHAQYNLSEIQIGLDNFWRRKEQEM